MLTSALVLLCQSLEPSPALAERGAQVVIRARAADGRPLADLPLRLRTPDGAMRDLGRTDARGELSFVAGVAGVLEVSAELQAGGPKLAVPIQVGTPAPRWLWALVCVPLGLGLVWLNLRPRNGGREAQPR